jgi:signal transduction histidine kinase
LSAAGRRFIVAGLVAALGAATAVAAAEDIKARDRHALNRAQAGVSGVVTGRFTKLDQRATQFATFLSRTSHQRIDARLSGAPRTDFTSFGLLAAAHDLTSTGQLGHASSTVPHGAQNLAELVQLDSVRSAASIARDTGQPVAVSVRAPSAPMFVVTWPVYSNGLPADTATRRATTVGWVVASSSLQDMIGPSLRVFEPIGITSTFTAADAGPGAIPDVGAATTSAEVTHFPHQSRMPVLFIAIITAIAAGCIAILALSRRRSDKVIEAHERALRKQMQLLSDISVTVQESLEIGVVLPGALTQIAQAHSLSYISVITGPGVGERGHLLSIGRPPALVPGQRWSPGMSAATPGQLVRLPLQRATRTLGYVEVVPTKSLNQDQMASLRSTTDLLANALHNAEMYEREQETVRRLRDLDEMKDDFLSTVSHELRTPLSVLVGFMSLLARKWDRLTEDDRREAVNKMQTHVTALAHLVNDLLDFVSERRNREAVPSEIKLNREVAAVVEQLRPLCERQDLSLMLSEDVPAWTDPRAVERILGNLVSNAAKYSPAGSTITVSTESRGDIAVAVVADQGPGIGPEERQRIFERFYRGESDAARSTRGSGIGLAVVHEWLQAVGARLDIASEPGVGTSISVLFPAQPDSAIADPGTIRWIEAALAQRSVSHETA